MIETLTFLVFAALALGSSIVVVAHRNPIYSTMSLVLTLFSVAVLFVMLGAPFIGVLQVLIYTGAIVVLFLFVIMLLNVGRQEPQIAGQGAQIAGALLGAVLFAILLGAALLRTAGRAPGPLTADMVSLPAFSQQLFHDYLLPFEIVGLLLLVAVVGATVVARRPPQAASTTPAAEDSEP